VQCNNTPHCAKFHRTRPNDVWEKRYKFLRPSVFWRPGGPLGLKLTEVSAVMYSKARTINVPNFIPFWHPALRDICCQTSLISLKARPAKTSKRRVSAYHATTKRWHESRWTSRYVADSTPSLYLYLAYYVKNKNNVERHFPYWTSTSATSRKKATERSTRMENSTVLSTNDSRWVQHKPDDLIKTKGDYYKV